MQPSDLHVVTCISNPIMWKSRIALADIAIKSWLKAGVSITLVECAFGDRPHDLEYLTELGVNHLGVRAKTLVWNKENLLNLGLTRLPDDAKYIAFLDADILFRKDTWALDTLNALQIYPVVQPWSYAYDLGPADAHMQVHKSFASIFHAGLPVVPEGANFWKFNSGPYDYPHPGYAWAWRREALDAVGGLIEFAAMGSGDHHMALCLVGSWERSIPKVAHDSYKQLLQAWQVRATKAINFKIGYVPGTIEHMFHGRKGNRGYISRWDMFMMHEFNPLLDIIKNSHGVVEFAGNKPDLERHFDNYLRNREEDVNTIT